MSMISKRCMKLVVIHFSMMPQGFSVCLHSLIVNGPKQPLPVDQNGGLYSHRRDGGKSAIFRITGLALHLTRFTIVLVVLDGFSTMHNPVLHLIS